MPSDVLAKLEREAQVLDPALESSNLSESPEKNTSNTEELASPKPTKTVAGSKPKKDSTSEYAAPEAPSLGAAILGSKPGFGSVDEALTYGLGRGGGPFGPRDAKFRLILLPDSRYHSRLPELRDGIHQHLGIDKYTAVQALQKEIPSYLASADDLRTAETLVGPLWRLGARVLLLERHRWLQDAGPNEWPA